MTIEKDDCISTARSEVQRLLGQCVLKLQGFEWRLKVILTHHRVSGSAISLEDAIKARVDEFDRLTLGNLVGQMMGSFIVADAPQEPSSVTNDAPEIETRAWIVLPAEEFASAEADLRALVALRNRLVHHFLEDHELRSLEGCEKARVALIEALDRITKASDVLQIWADDLISLQSRIAELLNTPEIRDTFIGGTIARPITHIVQALREAEIALARDGWAPVLLAEEWLLQHYPDEQPAGYGCKNWRQVIHDSRLFDLRYRKVDGRRQAWFRSKSANHSVQ